jgi:hypothetical protein
MDKEKVRRKGGGKKKRKHDVYTHTMEYYSAFKKNKILPLYHDIDELEGNCIRQNKPGTER